MTATTNASRRAGLSLGTRVFLVTSLLILLSVGTAVVLTSLRVQSTARTEADRALKSSAAVQSLVQPNCRATATAIMLFIANLVGLGMGPLAVGLLSDALAVQWGMDAGSAIRWALLASSVLVLLCAWMFWTSGRTLREELVS